jgi:hypothetical protein
MPTKTERYIVQWVTEWDDNNHITRVSGYCVRDKNNLGWPTLFKHKEENVCQKIADMLNEEEEHNKC